MSTLARIAFSGAIRLLSSAGAARFKELVKAGFFTGSRFFRVIPNFMAQFGIAKEPDYHKIWSAKTMKDDPVLPTIHNTRGMVSFAHAGKDTRSTQLFINFGDNSRLDSMTFTPIGKIVEGMDVVDRIESKHGEKPDQGRIVQSGEKYLAQEYPDLTKIVDTSMLVTSRISDEVVASGGCRDSHA